MAEHGTLINVGIRGAEDIHDSQWSCAEETSETDAESSGMHTITLHQSIFQSAVELIRQFLYFINLLTFSLVQ